MQLETSSHRKEDMLFNIITINYQIMKKSVSNLSEDNNLDEFPLREIKGYYYLMLFLFNSKYLNATSTPFFFRKLTTLILIFFKRMWSSW